MKNGIPEVEKSVFGTPFFICPAFETPYKFVFNVNILLFILRYVIKNCIAKCRILSQLLHKLFI